MFVLQSFFSFFPYSFIWPKKNLCGLFDEIYYSLWAMYELTVLAELSFNYKVMYSSLVLFNGISK